MKVWRFKQQPEIPANDDIVPEFVARQVTNLARIINESTQIAAKSTVLQTRRSRLSLVIEKLAELKAIIENYPRLSLTSFDQFEHGLREVAAEIAEQGSHAPYVRGDDLYAGWVFMAKLSISTPLRFLRKHGQRHDGATAPDGHDEFWEYGSWHRRLKTLREIGVDVDEQPSSMASPIGPIPVDGGNYLPFLVAVRTTVEADTSIDDRVRALRHELDQPAWADIIAQPGHYAESIGNYFFPKFLTTAPNLPHHAAMAMWDVALDTPARIDQASDEQLLAFKGIGPAVLRRLRARCAEITEGRDEPLLDMVNRT